MEAYFDNSATTKVLPEVVEIMNEAFINDYGNPSSMHRRGVNAEKYLKEARQIISKTLKVNEKEILFTSGGTESNNMALIGTAMANKRSGNHIIVSAIEHSAIIEPAKYLEDNGFEVTYLPVDNMGRVDLVKLSEAITDNTILVSIMYVNNEIGTVEPIEEISKIIKEKNAKTYFHVDAIQAYGKFSIFPKKLGVDMLSVSSHKIHGPKGVGFLYIAENVKIKPIIFGGGQQKGMRSGTDNVPGIAGMARAAKLMYDNLNQNVEKLYELREYFIQEVTKIEGISINGSTDRDFAPHIVSIYVKNVRSEVLLHALEDKEIYVSAGSACSSNKPAPSRTLLAIGSPKEVVESTVRISFSSLNTKEEIDYVVENLKTIVPMLQRFVRK